MITKSPSVFNSADRLLIILSYFIEILTYLLSVPARAQVVVSRYQIVAGDLFSGKVWLNYGW